MPARQYLRPTERAIAIFTRGDNFVINADQTGYSASSTINPNRHLDRVIIYHREQDGKSANLYIATFTASSHEREDRYVVHFEHIQYIGTTDENWHTFADTGALPFRYLP